MVFTIERSGVTDLAAGVPREFWAGLRQDVSRFIRQQQHRTLHIGLPWGGQAVVTKGLGGLLLVEVAGQAVVLPVDAVRRLLRV